MGLGLYQDIGLQADQISVQNTWADGIQNQDMIGMVETNLYISNTGDDGLAFQCSGSSCPTPSGGTPNYGIAANVVEDHIGTFGMATGGKAISIDAAQGLTVSGLKATNISADCVQVYNDRTVIPDAIVLNDIGCTNVGIITNSGGATGISIDAARSVSINNPQIDTTSASNTNPARGIHVKDTGASVWVNGGVLKNLGGAGVQVESAKLFHITGTEVLGANDRGVDIGATSDTRVTNVLIKDVAKTGGLYRAVSLEGLSGLLDVRGVTIQDDQSTATGFRFFTSGLSTVIGVIDGVFGYVADTSNPFVFYSGSTDTILRRNFSGVNATKPICNDTSFEGLTWYVRGSGTATGTFQVCQYMSPGGYGWNTH